MKLKLSIFIILCFNQLSCQRTDTKARSEILQTEIDFAKSAKEEGVATAFYKFAAEDAVIQRDSLYKGKNAIKRYYEKQSNKSVKLAWTVDFVDAAKDGDLGYTYGKFVHSTQDTTGKTINFSGIFHTVWKRQIDGKWRFVWD